MAPHFSDQCGTIVIDDDFVDMLRASEDPAEQERFILEFLENTDSPYELTNLVLPGHHRDLEAVCPELASLVIEYIITNAHRWDQDEVAWFFLELLFEYPTCPIDVSALFRLNNPGMIRLESAGEYIWDLFWSGADPDALARLFDHYGWRDYLAHKLESLADQSADGSEESLGYHVAAEMMRQGVLSADPDSATRDYAEGMHSLQAQDYAGAIDPLLSFHTEHPSVFPVQICLGIATCQRAFGWDTFALDWTEKALAIDPSNWEAEQLRIDILTPHTFPALKIEDEVCQSHWTPDCCEVIIATEVIFRFHGRMSHDYGAIINGYGRAVEVQLRQAVLPQIRDLVETYGSLDDKGRRCLRCGGDGKEKLRSSDCDRSFMLGKWVSIFALAQGSGALEDHGCFYYHATRNNEERLGFYEWAEQLRDFDEKLNALKELRNDGSHGVARTWDDVIQARDRCFDLLKDMLTSLGNQHRYSPRPDSEQPSG